METLLAGLSDHGYLILFASVFLETVGFPVPAALALLIAGGAIARGSMAPYAVVGALLAMLSGDVLMFFLGRYTGWWLLGLLCRLSLNPESCILRAADSFRKRGRLLLVVAKFMPGINSMAPPLAGSMNMRPSQFLRFDAAGASLYVGSYMLLGFIFSDALGSITKRYQSFSQALGWVVGALVAGYAIFQVWLWIRARSQSPVPSVDPAEAALDGSAIIYDVRSHGYYDSKATRIKGSKRLDPNALPEHEDNVPSDRPVYLYCTCIREATSAKVARELQKKGVNVAVIKGGLRDWKKTGLPTEPVPPEEIAELPGFDT